MVRKSFAFLSASLVLLSGAAVSADTVESGTVRVVAYLPISDRILGDPAGPALPRLFQRSVSTIHLPGSLTQFPPSPCRVHALTWNTIVATIPEPEFAANSGGDGDFEQAYGALSLTLGFMAVSSCNVEIVRDSANRIVSIMPVP